MSSLIVEVSRIQKLLPHPNADRLELVHIKGWQCVVRKGKYVQGALVTYIPPDSVLPIELSERIGITKYLSHGRVRCARLRGEPSFGVVMDAEAGEGEDVAARYGITKYVPPIKTSVGDALPSHPLFASYTEIENMRNFPEVIADGEEVIATEKIHGTNCRVGRIDGVPMAGSKQIHRKRPEAENAVAADLYWHPWSLEAVKNLMASFHPDVRQVILFGEVYGKVQSLRYGINGIAFRAFDILLDGKYLDAPDFAELCQRHGVATVPAIYSGPFRLEEIKAMAEGKSTVPGAANIREGVVVRPVRERFDPKIGRVILKYLGDGYLLGDISDTDDQ